MSLRADSATPRAQGIQLPSSATRPYQQRADGSYSIIRAGFQGRRKLKEAFSYPWNLSDTDLPYGTISKDESASMRGRKGGFAPTLRTRFLVQLRRISARAVWIP